MKTLVLAILLLVPSFLVRGDLPWMLPVTNGIPAVSTNSAAVEWPMELSDKVSIQMVGGLAGPGASNLTATVEYSVNRTNWHTAATMALAMSGTNRVSYLTNLSIGAMPWMRVKPFVNANTSAVNYLEFWINRKRGF